jgi:hypothetical protein
MYGTGITHKELLSVGYVVSLLAGTLDPDRDAERDMRVLYKWFDENWVKVGPWIAAVNLRDKEGEIISLERELNEKR